ncbi:MAG: SDR family oxidoreductase [Rhodospirillaceae bacterium]|nr:SDR family oxidoreductase [Rhodospirillaceae bacterium]
MTGRLAGKVAVMTASGAGIGRAAAKAFATEGAAVWATDVDEAALASLADEVPGIRTRRLDVTDAPGITALAEEVGTADVLFNCAGFVHNGTILDCTETDWDRSFDINVRSMYRMIRAFLPGMLAAGRGSIVNIASVASSVTGVPNRFVYGTTKAAVIGLTKGIVADFTGRGIRCNAICPGTVHSPSLEQRMADTGDRDTAFGAFVARQPMGRLGKPEEIAAIAVYLASDEAAFTTGATFVVDGGWTN